MTGVVAPGLPGAALGAAAMIRGDVSRLRRPRPRGGSSNEDVKLAVLRRLYADGFPIRRMVPVDAYRGNDERSIEADNTSAFRGSKNAPSLHVVCACTSARSGSMRCLTASMSRPAPRSGEKSRTLSREKADNAAVRLWWLSRYRVVHGAVSDAYPDPGTVGCPEKGLDGVRRGRGVLGEWMCLGTPTGPCCRGSRHRARRSRIWMLLEIMFRADFSVGMKVA